MGALKRLGILIVFVSIIMVFSSCGGTSSTTTGGSSTTSSSSSNNGYNQGSSPTKAPAATPSSAATTSGNVVVKTASATVDGKSMTILTDAKGMTLYYFTPDTASKTVCTAGCAQTWPPLLFTAAGKPAASPTLPGELEIYPNANGKQVIYNDHPLYTYGGDSGPGQTNGQGIAGKWFVATPTIPKNKP